MKVRIYNTSTEWQDATIEELRKVMIANADIRLTSRCEWTYSTYLDIIDDEGDERRVTVKGKTHDEEWATLDDRHDMREWNARQERIARVLEDKMIEEVENL